MCPRKESSSPSTASQLPVSRRCGRCVRASGLSCRCSRERANRGRYARVRRLPMTSFLIDINVWLALTWDLHPQHVPAARWYASLDDSALLFCRFTMLGFLRLLTDRQVMGDSTTTVAGALQLYDRWRQDPRVEMAAEPR